MYWNEPTCQSATASPRSMRATRGYSSGLAAPSTPNWTRPKRSGDSENSFRCTNSEAHLLNGIQRKGIISDNYVLNMIRARCK